MCTALRAGKTAGSLQGDSSRNNRQGHLNAKSKGGCSSSVERGQETPFLPFHINKTAENTPNQKT